MKKVITIIALMSLLCVAALGMTAQASTVAYSQDFESAADVAATGWVPFGTTNALALVDHAGSKCLELAVEQTWHSPAYNIYDAIKAGGAGDYTIQMDISADTFVEGVTMNCLIRGSGAADANSFIEDKDGTNYYAILGSYVGDLDDEAFGTVEVTLTVTESDIADAAHTWNLMMDTMPIADGVTKFYIDNVTITKDGGSTGGTEATPAPTGESTADVSTIAYAVAAVSGLGALAIRRKK